MRIGLLILTMLATGSPWAALTPTLRQGPEAERLRAERSGPAGLLNLQPGLYMAGLNERDRPVYYEAHTLVAAQSMRLDELWPGGSAGTQLTGAGIQTLGMWDAGAPRPTHLEYVGRVLQQDDASSVATHSTAVAGILVATGLGAGVRGMAPAAQLKCWDWNDDQTEMQNAAWSGLQISNHSYGAAVGWGLVGSTWYWYGDPALDSHEDTDFGYYNSTAALMDELTWLEPHYLMVRSAGNHRLDTGPGPATPHFVFQNGSWTQSFDPRDPDGGGTGFDTLPPEAVFKNGLVVGAVEDLPLGWTNPEGVVLTSFTSYGPSDDGRIKPDLVSNGTSLITTSRAADSDYTAFSGTSAAAPTVAGAAALLSQLYALGHSGPAGAPQAPLSSTLRGLLLHTADEVGPGAGPDYQAGWGMVNARSAADLLLDDNARRRRILQGRLSANSQKWINMRTLGGPVRVTLAWTDYPAVPQPPALDNPSPRLVHDLNLSLHSLTGPEERLAWALDPTHPDRPAQALGNHLDNVERVDWQPAAPGEYFQLRIQADALQAAQDWSLLLTGLEPVAKLRFQSTRSVVALGDTLLLEVELDGGLAVRGIDLDMSWPAGALRLIAAEPGPVLQDGGFTPQVTVLDARLDGAHLVLDRVGDSQGLDLPSGTVARLSVVVQTLSLLPVDFSSSQVISVTGDTSQVVEWESILLNVGSDPPDLELRPGDLAP
ncbi:MAG: S8 family serine peptidase [Candidatus Delongbacteria bacterium]